MKKYIFLDIDGVLNTEINILQLIKEKKLTTDQYGCLFDPIAVANLATIVENTNASIIISSSWRIAGLETMRALWEARKLHGNIVDITTNNMGMESRGKVIQQWYSHHKKRGDRYVILDDVNDMLPSQQPYFIEINPIVGITYENAQKAIQLLQYCYIFLILIGIQKIIFFES